MIQTVSIFDSFAEVTSGTSYKHKKAFLTERQQYQKPSMTAPAWERGYNLTMEPGDYLAFYAVNVAFRYLMIRTEASTAQRTDLKHFRPHSFKSLG